MKEEEQLLQEILTLSKEYASTMEKFLDLIKGQKLDAQTRSILRINYYQMIGTWSKDLGTAKELGEKFEQLLEKH